MSQYTISYANRQGQLISWTHTKKPNIEDQEGIPSGADRFMMWEVNPDGPSTPLFDAPQLIPADLKPR